MKMKPFKYNGYRAQGELTVLVPPTTPFERGRAVVKIHSDAEIGTYVDNNALDCVIKAFLPKSAQKGIRVESQTVPDDGYLYADNTIVFSFQY